MNTLIRSPPQPPSLSSYNAYTTWPGGVDPTASLFNTDNQRVGGRRSRKNRKNARKSRKNMRKSRKSRK